MKINKYGYYETGAKRKGRTTLVHRQVMEKKIGRKLLSTEIVHHKDENKLNNDPDNLELFSSHKEHAIHHLLEKGHVFGEKICKCCKERKKHFEFLSKGYCNKKKRFSANCIECTKRIRKLDNKRNELKIIFKLINHVA